MQQLFLFLIAGMIYLPLSAQKQQTRTTYFRGTEQIKTSCEVLRKKPDIKHGVFLRYDEQGVLRAQGTYEMNQKNGIWKEFGPDGTLKMTINYVKGRKISEKKSGIWLTTLENGQVIKGYDYDQNTPLETQISVPVRYPEKARANKIEGTVKIQIQLNARCEADTLAVVEGVGFGCDEEALKVVKKIIALTRKYAPEKCIEINRVLPVHFKLTLLGCERRKDALRCPVRYSLGSSLKLFC